MKHIDTVIRELGYTPTVWNPKAVASFWDFESRTLQNYFAFLNGKALIRFLSDKIPLGGRLLDYGGGSGIFLQYLIDHKLTAGASDISPESVNSINQRNAGKKGFLGAHLAGSDALSAHPWDGVFLTEVVEHLAEPIRIEVLREVYQLLKPGGWLVVTVPNDENLENLLMVNPIDGSLMHRWQHEYSFEAKDMNAILEKAGFRNVQSHTISLSFYHSGWKNVLRRWRERMCGYKAANLVTIAFKPE